MSRRKAGYLVLKEYVMRKFLIAILLALSAGVQAQVRVEAPESPYGFAPLEMYAFPSRDFPITRYGARPDDVKANIQAFAKAMTACNKAGGGRVVVPAGEWHTGPIHFLNNVNLYLSEGATVVFEDDPQLYLPAVRTSWEGAECMNLSPLVYAYGCENVGISGPGALAPKTEFWKTWYERTDSHLQATRQLYAMCSTQVPVENRRMEAEGVRMRPHLIQFNRCRNVNLDGFSIRESPFWTIHMYMSEDVWVHGLKVRAHGANNDGIDIELTQHILVEDCSFDQGDDAVVIKAGRNQDGWALDHPTQDVVIRNCEIIKGHCLIGIGSEMSGGVRRVYMHDCHSSDEVHRLLFIKTNHRRGGFIEDITVENVSAARTLCMLEINTDVMYQWRTIVPTFETVITDINNITLRNAECAVADVVCKLRGDERLPIKTVSLENVHIGELLKYENVVSHVEDFRMKNVVWDSFDESGTRTAIDYTPGN